MTSYVQLRQEARQRLNESTVGKTRVLIQLGHCSQAVGAAEITQRLADALASRPDVNLVEGGCDGACFAAPQVLVTSATGEVRRYGRVTLDQVTELVGEIPLDPPLREGETLSLDEFFGARHRLLLAHCGLIDPASIDEYLTAGGYLGLSAAIALSPAQVIDTVIDAGLLGRGGAYFPAGRKWQTALGVDSADRYLVVNAEEGEPGLFKDRHLMEGNPHLVLEGMLIAAYAAGASHAYIYINAEAGLSAQRMERAVEQATSLGLIGRDILGSEFSLDVEIRRGAGGYVCGEETTLLNTIEGMRREPRLRPPFPAEAGIFQKPTVINNIETLANVPFILAQAMPTGAEPLSEIETTSSPPFAKGGWGDFPAQLPPTIPWSRSGIESAKGTKLICLSGAVSRPGLAEVPMGADLRQVVYDIGGGPPPGREVAFLSVGGPSSGLLPVSEIDLELRPGVMHPSGVVMGGGGVTVFDQTASALDVLRSLAAYNASESCGKCTPCREGTVRLLETLDKMASGGGSPEHLDELSYLAEVTGAASLCGLGQMAGNPINSALHFFRKDLESLSGI